ncbi:MAG: hypothetical protein ACR2PT_08960 [Endozoicomonas sp.]
MTAGSRVLVKNRVLSILSRGLMALLVLAAVTACVGINLPYLYRLQVDEYFSHDQANEQNLLIRSGRYTVLAKGVNNRDNFGPLLSHELGEYKAHRFVGWTADVDHFLDNGELPYTMVYEVEYQKVSTEEHFHFTGFLSPVLAARDVRLLGE